LWLSIGGYAIVNQLASGSALFAPFEWLWNTGSFVVPKAILWWFLGLLLLGIAAARQPLPARLRILPLALFALTVPSYLLRYFDFGTVFGNPVIAGIVSVFGQSLPFVGIASLGWVLLTDADEPSAVKGAGVARAMAKSASWPAAEAGGRPRMDPRRATERLKARAGAQRGRRVVSRGLRARGGLMRVDVHCTR
jgi:hypothetical protein